MERVVLRDVLVGVHAQRSPLSVCHVSSTQNDEERDHAAIVHPPTDGEHDLNTHLRTSSGTSR